MKDAMHFLIPMVQDPMNVITGKCISHHVSTNGYYGYQPVVGKTEGRSQQQNSPMERMDTCDDDIQFNNCMEPEEPEVPKRNDLRNGGNRKRTWEYEDCGSCKKRREVDPLPQFLEQPTNYKREMVRKPTHNIPDMARCMMGHYI